MPVATEEDPLTLHVGLAQSRAIYMPARNYSKRTREEYESDLSTLYPSSPDGRGHNLFGYCVWVSTLVWDSSNSLV